MFIVEQPGWFFVIATLLPLVSFTILLVLAAARWTLRPHAKANATVNTIFQMLGGEVTGYGPALVAFVAIALAFVCSAVGFGWFLVEAHEMHHLEQGLGLHDSHGHDTQAHDKQPLAKQPHHDNDDHGHAKEKEKPKPKAKEQLPVKPLDAKAKKKAAEAAAKKKHEDEARLALLQSHWQYSGTWARIWPAHVKDHKRGTELSLGFRIDMLAAIMFVMVTFVATLIHLFSMGYMVDELQPTVEDHEVHTAHGHYHRRGRFGRFFMFLSLFCFSMLNLILADNLFQIFISWELVGICSYLLIGFYFERTSASNAANKAFITNRIGDAGFILGVIIIWSYFGTVNFQEMFAMIRCPRADSHGEIIIDGKKAAHRIIRANLTESEGDGASEFALDKNGEVALLFPRKPKSHFHGPQSEHDVSNQPKAWEYSYIPYWMLVVAGLGIFLGCIGKSAQFPLQVWLPDAMEGPTPVSALIHAATMVAAGVYLVGRCYPLFTAEVLLTIAYIGAITLFVAATTAVVMTDIKKVLAYSTVSQLGYMMLALGVGGWTAGLLHLLTHAFFKALLFLGSGSVIYGCHHQQDMQKMGGLYPKMKITAITMLMGVLAISGIPFFSGWYSKDAILADALVHAMIHKQHFLLFLLPLLTAGLTTFYMFRMWLMTFTGKPRDEHVYEHATESPWMLTVPLILLAILSVGAAWGWPPHLADKSWLGQHLHEYSQPKSVNVDFAAEVNLMHRNHDLHPVAGGLALGMVVLGLTFALSLYFYRVLDPVEGKEQFAGVHRFLMHKWYFDEFYSAAVVRPALIISGWCRNFDLKLIDGFLHLVAYCSLVSSRWSGRFDHGVIDGLVNVLADVSYAVGNWLRNVQTGSIRNYVLFLALAAMSIWVLLYAWSTALGGVR